MLPWIFAVLAFINAGLFYGAASARNPLSPSPALIITPAIPPTDHDILRVTD
jgi:hypothetical protein